MSREVRRVPIGWKHPVRPNPYWREQAASAILRDQPTSLLHRPEDRFVGLIDDYEGALASWEQEGREITDRVGHHWTFNVEYHLTGFTDQDGHTKIHPFYGWSDDDTETETPVRDEDHLHELVIAKHADEKPNPDHYMPVFDESDDDLGWCLYETVSEGTPVTPVFATADELIEHLSVHGQDWNQQPMRRSAAEALVHSGFSMGSFLVVNGQMFKSDEDADVIAGMPR